MFSWSNITPAAVHTGVVNGCRLSAQKLNGSRLNVACAPLPSAPPRTPDPADAEYASLEAHSECVICQYDQHQKKKLEKVVKRLRERECGGRT